MAEIRIINLPTRTPVLSSDYFVFEKKTSENYYVTSKNVLSSLNLLFKESFQPEIDDIVSSIGLSSIPWNSSYLTVNLLSSNWESTYNTVSSLSAQWSIDSTSDTEVRELTSNWESTYTTVGIISTLNNFVSVESLDPEGYQLALGTEILPLSCEWSNTLTGQVSSLVVKLNGEIRRIPIFE
jgi:hypothetical protein